MTDEPHPSPESCELSIYQIRVKGHLGPQWTDWFEGQTITLDANGETVITGPVVDQAALHGLLKKVRDLGAPLISVARLEPDRAAAPDSQPPPAD